MLLKNCKKQAKNCLKKRRVRAVRISLCIRAAAILSGAAAYAVMQKADFGKYTDCLLLVLQIALCILTCGLLGAMREGRTAWLYCSACGKEPSGVQFLYWLRRGRGFRAAWLFLNLRVRKAAWTAMLSLPGAVMLTAGILLVDRISRDVRMFTFAGGAVCLTLGVVLAWIIRQKYALAPILLVRSPQKGVRSAIRNSCFLMEEDCANLCRLQLSFLPWAAACITMIPLVYVVPYYQQAKTCMLRSILRAHTV